MAIDTRAPDNVRVSRSRPTPSVPNQCRALGGASMASQSTASNAQGESAGPASAPTTTTASTAQQTRASTLPNSASRMADARVQPGVQQVRK